MILAAISYGWIIAASAIYCAGVGRPDLFMSPFTQWPAETLTFNLAHRIRSVMPDVLTAYPYAKVEVTPHGLLLKSSLAAVPKTAVNGFRLA